MTEVIVAVYAQLFFQMAVEQTKLNMMAVRQTKQQRRPLRPYRSHSPLSVCLDPSLPPLQPLSVTLPWFPLIALCPFAPRSLHSSIN